MPSAETKIGVLALQGGFAAHLKQLSRLGIKGREVKTVADLALCDGLILPGGESTVFQIVGSHILEELLHFPGPLFGTCAGAIILAKLGLIEMTVERNAYGRQIDSFTQEVDFQGDKIEALFIRAPRITHVGKEVEVLIQDRFPLCVKQGKCLAATFHPELTSTLLLHAYFLEMVENQEYTEVSSSSSLKR